MTCSLALPPKPETQPLPQPLPFSASYPPLSGTLADSTFGIHGTCLLLLDFCATEVVWPPGFPLNSTLDSLLPPGPFLRKSCKNAVWEKGSLWPAGARDMRRGAGTTLFPEGPVWANPLREEGTHQGDGSMQRGQSASRHEVGELNTGGKREWSYVAKREREYSRMKQDAKSGARSRKTLSTVLSSWEFTLKAVLTLRDFKQEDNVINKG